MPAFEPFITDHPVPDSIDDREAWASFYEAQARQKAAVPESELRADARSLIKQAAKHWTYGVYATMWLAELLEEKRRRLREDGYWDVNDRLSTWLKACMQLPEDDIDLRALPSPDDCFKLVNNVAHCGDDGMGRPGFFDIGA